MWCCCFAGLLQGVPVLLTLRFTLTGVSCVARSEVDFSSWYGVFGSQLQGISCPVDAVRQLGGSVHTGEHRSIVHRVLRRLDGDAHACTGDPSSDEVTCGDVQHVITWEVLQRFHDDEHVAMQTVFLFANFVSAYVLRFALRADVLD